jgi:nicotinamidase-related amidase
MYTLVIVDMQSHFYAKEELEITKNLKREILGAINNQASIVFVEFDHSGPTLECLTKLPEQHGYRSYTIEKQQNDGSHEVGALVIDKSLPVKHFKVAGINTDYCIASTVIGLSNLFPDGVIEVIDNCCASLWSMYGKPCNADHKNGLAMLKGIENVVITNSTQLI